MEDSIAHWIQQLKQGDHEAAARLWDRFFQRIVSYARSRLGTMPKRMADEEDVALSVFDSLCRGAARGGFPRLSDRENLWSLLTVITARKVYDHIAFEHAEKRGGGAVRALSDLARGDDSAILDAVLEHEPSPETAAIFAEECERLLNRLDPELRHIAVRKMEGYSDAELAKELDCGLRTIERRLKLVRDRWQMATE